jgi:glutaredoxin
MQAKLNPKSAIVWSSANCPWCERAKALLKTHDIPFQVLEIGKDAVTKEMFLQANPGARTVPQVWLDGKLIGGFDNLKEALA